VEGSWRAHQIPILDPATNPPHLAELEAWMRSYKPEELFARVIADVREGRSSTGIITTAGQTLRVNEQPMQGGGWVSTLEDITKWQEAQAQIVHMARHDGLTNLPNRTLFRERMEHALCRVARGGQIAVHCLDLDNFKNVNDSLGHPIGDQLLEEVARRLRECVRDGDTVARLGGDEFALVQLSGELRASDISSLASRVVEVVGAPYEIQGHQVVVGTSIGISVAPADGNDPDQLLKNADMALYWAKAERRGSWRFFDQRTLSGTTHAAGMPSQSINGSTDRGYAGVLS